MADDPTTEPGQEPAPAPSTPPTTPPAPQPPAATPPSQAPVADSQDEPFDRERAEALIRKLRPFETEAAKLRKQVVAFEAEKHAAEDARLSEVERLSKHAAKLEADQAQDRRAYQERIVAYEVQLAASRLNIVDPDAAVKLLDHSELEYGDDGRPTNTEKVLKALVKDRPYLVAPATPAAPQAPRIAPTNGATPGAAQGTRRYNAAEMRDYAFYTANRDDIIRAQREGRIDP